MKVPFLKPRSKSDNKLETPTKSLIVFKGQEGSFNSFQDLAGESDSPERYISWRKKLEPWLTAIFQAEHLNLLVGNGLSIGISNAVGVSSASMEFDDFGSVPHAKNAKEYVKQRSESVGRGTDGNIEDYIHTAIQVINGLSAIGLGKEAQTWIDWLNQTLEKFIIEIITCEKNLSDKGKAINLIQSFLLSFVSRTTTRERTHIFTINYDRLIEFGADKSGLRLIDRFVGHLTPEYRSSRLNIDYHYNPPGIRGEPRYLEGVARFTKLHGSLDWQYNKENKNLSKYMIPFGNYKMLKEVIDEYSQVLIYPNSAKDIETTYYPYADLFRDFSSSICRPNSALVTYGYSFCDDHINRIIMDMLTIPSTHLVIISWGDESNRIKAFRKTIGRDKQMTIMVGKQFGDIEKLIQYYLPNPGIDLHSAREQKVIEARGESTGGK